MVSLYLDTLVLQQCWIILNPSQLLPFYDSHPHANLLVVYYCSSFSMKSKSRVTCMNTIARLTLTKLDRQSIGQHKIIVSIRDVFSSRALHHLSYLLMLAENTRILRVQCYNQA